MNVHISIDADDAVSARYQMAQLLGINLVERDNPVPAGRFEIAATDAAPAPEVEAAASEQTPAAEPVKPTRKRRTKAEVAAEQAATNGNLETPSMAAEAAQITTDPENRVGPEDSPETQAQDAADEAAESAANRSSEMTRDDVRIAMSGYVNKYGMAHAASDVPAVFANVLGAAPEGQSWSLSKIPEAGFAAVIKALNEAKDENPFKRVAA